jgi:hypothetical protein
MKINGNAWKKWIGVGLGLLLAADAALVIFLWRSAHEGPEAMRVQRDSLAAEAKLLQADVKRAEAIRASLPQVGKDCDKFYEQSFLNGATGYSDIDMDLASIAAKAGVKTSGFSFRQQEVKGRGVTEMSITTGVSADYPAIVQFINGLERSRNFYLLDDLRLNSVTAGAIRLDISLHTFFRT